MFMEQWPGDNTLYCTRISTYPLSSRTLEFITPRTIIDSDIDRGSTITFSRFSLFSLQISRHRERGRSRSFLPTRRSFFEWQLPDLLYSLPCISFSLSRLAADPASVRWEPKNVPMQRLLRRPQTVFLCVSINARRSPPTITDILKVLTYARRIFILNSIMYLSIGHTFAFHISDLKFSLQSWNKFLNIEDFIKICIKFLLLIIIMFCFT